MRKRACLCFSLKFHRDRHDLSIRTAKAKFWRIKFNRHGGRNEIQIGVICDTSLCSKVESGSDGDGSLEQRAGETQQAEQVLSAIESWELLETPVDAVS